MDDPIITSRKTDHIRINLEKDVTSSLSTGLERYRFIHQALPELDLNSIDLGQSIFGRQVKSPILISSMTGGTSDAGMINHALAEAAQAAGVAMGLGSMRAALENPDLDGPQAFQGAPGDGLGRVRPGEDDLPTAHGSREPFHAHGRPALRQLERPLAPAGRNADEGQSDEERPERLGHHRIKRRRSWLTRMSLRWSCT